MAREVGGVLRGGGGIRWKVQVQVKSRGNSSQMTCHRAGKCAIG
jgi:hypothetical protein